MRKIGKPIFGDEEMFPLIAYKCVKCGKEIFIGINVSVNIPPVEFAPYAYHLISKCKCGYKNKVNIITEVT